MAIFTRHGPVRVAEFWLDEPIVWDSADIIRCRFRSQLVPRSTSRVRHAIVLDLNRSKAALLSTMNMSTRQQIHRAEREHSLKCTISGNPAPELIAHFCSLYGEFARQKGLEMVKAPEMTRYAAQKMLAISEVRDRDDAVLVYHSYIVSRCPRVRLLHSASLFRTAPSGSERNRIGCANRFLHWHDIQHFQAEGFETYDFGGWYSGNVDTERLCINEFKRGFGGRITETYESEMATSLVGRSALFVWRLRNSMRSKASY